MAKNHSRSLVLVAAGIVALAVPAGLAASMLNPQSSSAAAMKIEAPFKPVLWKGNYAVTTSSDLAALPVKDKDLQDFYRKGLRRDKKGCSQRFGLQVHRNDGWVMNNVGGQGPKGCTQGGYAQILRLTEEGYKEVMGGQQAPSCTEVNKVGVPADLVATCYITDSHGNIVMKKNTNK